MMFQKFLVVALVLGMAAGGVCRADSWEANINAGSTSVLGGLHYKKDLNTGYMKTGLSGLYTDDDDLEYKWAEAKFAVGRDTTQPGLTVEIGMDGILGDADEHGFSGDVGAVPFTGYIGYTFPRRVMPIPLEVFGGLSYVRKCFRFATQRRISPIAPALGSVLFPTLRSGSNTSTRTLTLKRGPDHGTWMTGYSDYRW